MAGILALTILSGQSHGQTNLYWRLEAANKNWSDANNWWNGSGTQAPAGSEILHFGNTIQTEMTNDLTGSAANRYRINFDSGSGERTISGSTENTFFDFSGSAPAIYNNSGANQTIGFKIINGNSNGSNRLELNANSGKLIFNSNSNISASGGSRTVVAMGSSDIDMSGTVMQETGATLNLKKEGSGTLTLSGNNSFTGGVAFTDGRINFNHSSAAGTGTIEVSDTADEFSSSSGTVSLANSITLNTTSGTTKFYSTGTRLELSGTISGSGKILRDNTGAGDLRLSGDNSFSGGVTVTSRGIRLAHKNALGTGTFSIGGGSTPGTAITITADTALEGGNAIPNAVSWNQDFTLAAVNSLEFSGATTLSGDRTATVNSGKTLTFSGGISGSGASLIKAGLGTLKLSASNSYTGATSITGGTLLLGASNVLPDASNITLSGATLATGGYSDTVGTLTQTGTSTIDLGSGSSTLTFADSHALGWSGTLNIWNWSGGSDHLFFGSDSSGLTSGQASLVQFYSGTTGATFLGTGQMLGSGELVPVPEPAAALTAALLALPAFRRERGKCRRVS